MRAASLPITMIRMIAAAALLTAAGCSCSGPSHWAQRSPVIAPDSMGSSAQPTLAAAPERPRPGASAAVVIAPEPPPQN